MMEPDPIDLRPLGLNDLRRERMVRAVLARAQAGAVRTPLGVLAGWARPTLAAAAVVTAISLGTLAWPDAPAPSAPLTIADGLRLPEPAADWIAEDRSPTEADLLESWDP
ncbi:MAG TPA: hypothetical protein VGC13_12490 [Longimicrobium sp.]|jgi:hypothetical protein|uniref:hypothetical protein n=1 Tax=Longimicrobium sp. TaxID=2029185 RepID=UPI002EDA5B26